MTDKSINEFLKEMADVGFSFKFKATNGDDVYLGEAKDGVVKARKQPSQKEAMQRIKSRL